MLLVLRAVHQNQFVDVVTSETQDLMVLTSPQTFSVLFLRIGGNWEHQIDVIFQFENNKPRAPLAL